MADLVLNGDTYGEGINCSKAVLHVPDIDSRAIAVDDPVFTCGNDNPLCCKDKEDTENPEGCSYGRCSMTFALWHLWLTSYPAMPLPFDQNTCTADGGAYPFCCEDLVFLRDSVA
jgi:hypothetical protein